MTGGAPPSRRAGEIFTPTRIAIGILVILLALSLALPDAGATWWLLAYLGLVVATAVVINGVRNEPGLWLGRRAVRRVIVIAIALVCAGLLTVTSGTPGGTGLLLILLMVLILLNIALGRATQRLATASDSTVDERQEAQRNQAHRIAYVVFAVVIGGILVIADLATTQSRVWLGDVLRGGGVFVFLELLFVLPGMVVAFLEPDRLLPDEREALAASAHATRARAGMALLALTVAIPIALSVLVLVLPPAVSSFTSRVRISTESSSPSTSATQVRNCRLFHSDAVVGRGFQATIPISALACWNGRTATESYGMNPSDCLPGDYAGVSVTTVRCTRTTAPDGTLRFIYETRISPLMLPFLGRDVTVTITMDKDGNVLQFP
jgi:hypothetical protein